MEQRYKRISLFEFQKKFPDKDVCLAYLSNKKWKDGFICPNCGHTNYCSAVRPLMIGNVQSVTE